MGLLRLVLAVAVIALHTQSDVFGIPGLSGFGFAAVDVFFVISGFYMAMILTEKYTAASPWVFYKSRALRLYPIYFVGVALGILVNWSALLTTFSTLTTPGKAYMALQNLLMVPQDMSSILCIPTESGGCATFESLSANPPSWSLAVELGFYLVAPFIVRRPRRLVVYFLAGAAYLVVLRAVTIPVTTAPFLMPIHDQYPLGYNFYPASFVYFAAGAIGYHLSRNGARAIYWLAVAGLLLLAFEPFYQIPFWQLPVFAAAVPALFALTKRNRIDRLIGELSYPIYVLHYPINEWFGPIRTAHLREFGWLTEGTWVALFSIAGAVVLHFSLDTLINRYRSSKRFMSGAQDVDLTTSGQIESPSRATLVPKLLMGPYFAVPVLIVGAILISQ